MCKQTCGQCHAWAWTCKKCGENLRVREELVCVPAWKKHFCDMDCFNKYSKGHPIPRFEAGIDEEQCLAAQHNIPCNDDAVN